MVLPSSTVTRLLSFHDDTTTRYRDVTELSRVSPLKGVDLVSSDSSQQLLQQVGAVGWRSCWFDGRRVSEPANQDAEDKKTRPRQEVPAHKRRKRSHANSLFTAAGIWDVLYKPMRCCRTAARI